MSDLDIRSLGMVASRMLTNYIKSKEREEQDRPEVEEDEIFDPAYLEVSGEDRTPNPFSPHAPCMPLLLLLLCLILPRRVWIL